MQKTTTTIKLRQYFRRLFPLFILLAIAGTITAQPYVNANLSTGTITASGVASPAGYTWSECQNPTGNTTVANTTAGAGAQIAGPNSVADDFTVPAGQGWNISKITVYGYSTGAAATPSPYSDIRVRIHKGNLPGGTATIVFGDLVTNRFSASSDALMYRIFNTVVTPATVPGTTRKIWKIEANIAPATLGPGVYWLEYMIGSPANGSNFTPLATPVGVRSLPGYNAIQSIAGGPFAALIDPGQGVPSPVNCDLPFIVDYTIVTPPACTPITGAVISSVNVAMTEGFEQATPPPAGWNVQNNSVPGLTNWFAGNLGVFPPHSGAGYIAANFNNTSGTNTISNWLIAPSLTLRNGDQIKFWTRTTTGAFPDRLQVRMSTNGNSANVGTTATDVGDFTNLLLDINPTYTPTGYPTAWTEMTATVAGVPAAGISGRFALRYFVENGGPGGANSDYIGIDDLTYVSSGNPTVCSGGPGNIKVVITGGTGPYTVVYNAAPGGNTTVPAYTSGNNIVVTPTANPTTYTLVSVTGADGCTSPSNTGSATFNTVSGSTSAILSQVQIPGPATQLISEDFVVAPPATWAIQNNSVPGGLISWFQGNNAVFAAPYGPATSYLAVNFNSTTGANTISNWAMPPSVLAKNGDVLTFWTRTTTGTFPDRLQVRMNKTDVAPIPAGSPTSVGNYTDLLLDINPTYSTTGYPTAWTKFSITMSGLAPAGQNVRFAFRYFVENGGPAGANSDYIGIDSVRYTTFPLVNPTTCTGSTANLKVDITGGTSPYTVVIGRTPPTPTASFTVTNYVSGTNIPVTPPVTTTYNLISVTSATGCLGTNNSGTPIVTVSPTVIGPIQIVDQPTGPLCAGDPKLLSVVGAPSTPCFTNATNILIPAGQPGTTSGPANPYPSNIVVSGLPTSGVSVASVTLTNITHTWESDISVLVQNPAGTQNVIVMSAVSGTENGGFGILNKTYTFSDAAPTGLTPTGPTNPSGTYKPTNNSTTRNWPAPGPGVVVQPLNPLLSTFTGDPNGTWKLYVFDAAGGDIGNIGGGWQICFTVPSAPPVGYTWLWSPAAGLSSTSTNPVAASPMVTTTYTVMGTAPSGCQTTAAITITVLDRPAVTQNPTDVTACGASTVTFTGAGSGAGATYSWQVSTTGAGGPWTTVSNGGIYSGATTTTLTVGPITPAMNGWRYRLVVSGTCPPAANSNSALLTVITQPTVTVSPNGTVCGGVAGLSGLALTASGASTYTWAPATGLYTNTTATTAYVAGSNANPVYAAPTTQTVYTVTGTAAATGCTNTATVIVNSTPPPPIVTPNPVSMCLGDPAVRLIATSAVPGTCTVASGTILVPIPDANPANTQNFTATSTLNVNCIPANATITGISVTLSVDNPRHTYVADLSFNLKSPSGTVLNLFRNLGATGGVNTTYPNTGIVDLTLSSASNNSLANANVPATGTLTGTYKADIINAVSAPFYTLGDPPGFPSTATSWTPMYNNAAGAANGTWTLALTDDGAGDVGSLSKWSIKFDYFVGVQTTAATWSPIGGLFLDAVGTPYNGTPRDTVWTRPTPAGVYNYNVTVQGINPVPIFTNPAAIPVLSNTISQSSVVVSNLPTSGVTVKSVTLNGFHHTWTGDVNIVLQNPAGTQNVILKADSQADPAGNTTSATLIFTDAAPISLPTGAIPSGTYKPTNRNGATFAFLPPGPTVTGPTFPASPTLSTFTGNMNGTWKLFAEDRVGLDDGAIDGGFSIEFNDPTPGCTSPARVVTVTVNNPIVITTQPVNHTICTNGSTSFTVAATGTNVTYQWQVSTDAGNTWTNIVNNANYAGATTATLTITNPPVAWNGYLYRAMVNGAVPCPSVPSNNVVLTVNPLPTITLTAAPYRNLLPGLQTTINANSSPAAATYQWFRNGVAVAPPAGTTGPGLTIGVDGIGTYSVRITDVNGCTNTSGTIVIGDSTSGRVFIYPNPTTGRFGVRYNPVHNGVSPFGVVVRDALGKLVWNQKYTLGQPFAPMNVDLSNMASGVYWVEVVDIDDNRLAVGRVVIGH